MASSEASGSPTNPNSAKTKQLPSRVRINIIPVGIVQRLRKEAEARIATQSRDRDFVLLEQAYRHARALRRMGRTYAGRLRVIETVGLFNMGPCLAQFFHDHENMWRATTKTHQTAQHADRNPTIDALTHIHIRIINVRNMFSRKWISSTCSPSVHRAIQESQIYDADILTLRDLLRDEFVRILTIWEDLSSIDLEDHELENIGPDHDVNDLGQDVEGMQIQSKTVVEVVSEPRMVHPSSGHKMGNTTTVKSTKGNYLPTPPPSPHSAFDEDTFPDEDDNDENDDYDDEDDDDRRCSICTEPYTESHRAFSLTRCSHTYGKACISNWVNSTARNANLCPQCRTKLCERRPRRPVQLLRRQVTPHIDDQNSLQSRLDYATHLFGRLADCHGCLWGAETRNDFFDRSMAGLNERFFTDGLAWAVVPDETSVDGWRLQRHDWHT